MKKITLSEIGLYYGNVEMPKGFEIDREILSKDRMEISDIALICISSLLLIGSSTVICLLNYRRICPVKKDNVVVVQAPEWK